MDFKLILFLQIYGFLLKITASQYDFQNQFYQNIPQQYYPQQNPIEYHFQSPAEYTPRSRHHKKYGSSGGKLPLEDYDYEDSEECKCSCSKCFEPKPCCRDSCLSCTQPQASQASIVFVPYPYPLIVSNVQNSTESTTMDRGTTITSTTTAAPVAVVRNAESDLKNMSKSTQSKLNLYQTSVRRRPTWMPKYGIVPIPDLLAEKLMSQWRGVKDLQARRLKRMDNSLDYL